MGPDVPSRPKFSWDIRNAPWTDAKGPQEGYSKAVKLWKSFHDKLPASNSNKIPVDLQGIVLQSQLYGRAVELCKKVPDDTIQSAEGAMKIAAAIHKCDPLSVVTDTFAKFTNLLHTVRGTSEQFRNFESRFDAAVCSYNSAASSAQLPDSLVSFILISNASLDDNQRVAILSAAAPKANGVDVTDDVTGALLNKINYADVSSIIRSFDKPKTAVHGNVPQNRNVPLSANSAVSRQQHSRRVTPEKLNELKSKSRCHKCNKMGHWARDKKCDQEDVRKWKAAQQSDGSSNAAQDENNKRLKTVTFHMAKIQEAHSYDDSDDSEPGPLVDDGAPYSGMGMVEFEKLRRCIMPNWNGLFDALPDAISHCPYWQYGKGEHRSERRRIVGSVLLSVLSDQGVPVNIRHLIIEGSSSWVIGRNVTEFTDIIHVNGNYLRLYTPDHVELTIQMENYLFHSYVSEYKFYHDEYPSLHDPFSASLVASTAVVTWKEKSRIIDRVHAHVCGHSNYTDISTLLKRNHLWDSQCGDYLSQILEKCEHCHIVESPSVNRPVSLSAMSREVNSVVCVDHFFLDEHILFHAMDAQSRYSIAHPVSSTNMEEAIQAFDVGWISAFWTPGEVQGDQAFSASEFKDYLHSLGIKFRPVPPRRHSKNMIESKHRIIRDVYLRLKSGNPDAPTKRLACQAVRITNDLYGNDVASAHELAKGFTRPVIHDSICVIPPDVLEAHAELLAKRKLNKILKSNAVKDKSVHVGDMVQIFVKLQNQKRGKWSEPKPVLKFDKTSQTVTVAGSKGKVVQAAIEDVRNAIGTGNDLLTAVQEAIDVCNHSLDDAVSSLPEASENDFEASPSMVNDEDFSGVNEHDLGDSSARTSMDGPSTSHEPTRANDIDDVDVYEDALDSLTHVPVAETLGAPSTHGMKLRDRSTLHSSEIEMHPGTELTSSEQDDLQQYFNRFKSKEFIYHQAQGLPPHTIENAYTAEQDAFLKICTKVHVSDVPKNANVIASHVLYKIKDLDDGTKRCKARIAPHGNRDSQKDFLRTDSASCPPLGIRIMLSICTILGFLISKIDIKSAFLQSGKATRDVYVIPPRECRNRSFYWLLEVATYGLVNANVKWQVHSDTTFLDMGLSAVLYIPQFFYLVQDGVLVLLVAKVVDDILVGGNDDDRRAFISRLAEIYTIGTIVHLPGSFKFFGLLIEQSVSGVLQISADEKLDEISCHTLTRHRRRELDAELNPVERFLFNSINGSLGFIGSTASPFAAFASSHLQQTKGSPTVKDLVHQNNILKKVKKFGSVSTFCKPEAGTYDISVLLFADAARPSTHGQLGIIGGLLLGPMEYGSPLHTVFWSSHLSKRPVRSSAAAEVLAAGSAIDEGKMIAKVYETLLGTPVYLRVAVDSKDLFSSLSTCRTPEDKSIRADVQLLRYNFETHQLNQLIWIPGKTNPADPLTKRDSPLEETVHVMLFAGTIPIEFNESERRQSDAPLG